MTGMDPMPPPPNGWVGRYCESSCVAVGRFWFVTARHIGGNVGQGIVMRGHQYIVVEIIPHPLYDVQLLRVAEELPGWHGMASNVAFGDPCILGGWGATAGGELPNSGGYNWNGPHVETWGANVIESEGALLAIRFDNPSSANAVPREAIYAINDSGAGLFVHGPDGSLQLAGIAISVSGFGQSQWSNSAFALNVDLYRTWMGPIVDPTQPVSSAVEAPRAMLSIPGLPGWLGGAAAVLALARRRRAA